jgi:pimeloyl-ACP methyl ester carboxylesterase
MHVLVNGVRLFFDVEGGRLVPDGPAMREKPTLLLLHGGPGLDHSIYRPAFSGLSDVAQVVFLDHRGNGRSDPGPRESWTLAQWADDVHAFCETLGIARPIVYGASFGGTVALAYATRHPEHPGKLILVSAEAAADTHLGRRVALFERSVDPRSARWRAAGCREPGPRGPRVGRGLAAPGLSAHTRTPRDPDVAKRAVRSLEVTHWFTRPDGEGHTFDFVRQISRVRCPTLVPGGKTIR